ncbi:uncharacterized protein LOC111910472 [Lactuca sativa]|uniref:uncharacterized protein LOC111910472 n=1 Tax=Lactuca sativa TaxID=4236 RepID=UPI001C68949D|nr:uncharacterized protein LOC111910472 [Lactuca sativa]
MKVVTTEAPQFWLCEECERKKLFSPTKTTDKEQIPEVLIQKNTRVLKSPNKSSFASRFNFKEKRVNTGRTKYISCDEAVKLSSGVNRSEQQPLSSRNAFSCKHGSSRSMPPPREKSLVKIYGATNNSKFEPQLQQPVAQKSTAVKDSIKSTKCSSVRVERTNTKSFSPRSEVLPPTKEEADIRKQIEVPKSSNKIEKNITQETIKMAKSEVLSPTKEEEAEIEVPKSSKKVEKTITQEITKMAKSEVLSPTQEEEAEIKVPKSSKKVDETNMKRGRKDWYMLFVNVIVSCHPC